ncbi:cell wall hydrolase [Sphingomonas baiyangensis]|uniref:Cell wall hydrolase n=1 Tax=Sphingomonas baiyangensis TaxID=2572576 RepID=A0A4U1L6X8_9SPHN|nr:cell wall hydrolase [Sphingomonas baiyangensis]
MLTAFSLSAVAIPALIVANAPPIIAVEQRIAQAPRRVIPPAELPPVEPIAFVAVSPDDAQTFNASIPFSTAPNLPARPFRITGSEADIARAADCLTAAVLYEAGDDTEGQRPVAQVVLNRVRHPAFPKSVCGVVFQGAERRTGCQFTFTCDGALRRRYSDAAWERARAVATAALKGYVDKSVGTATHYHTNWVVPYWSSSLDKIVEIKTHLFFRWTGWWGTPPAFRGRYLGAEPAIAKLASIAPAHAEGALADAANDGEAAASIETAALPAPTAADPDSFLVTLDPRLAPAQWSGWALRLCGDRPYCKVLAWTDAAETPATATTDARTMERVAFSYLRDNARGFDKALWNCDRFERPDLAQCMKARVFLPSTRRADDFRLEMLPGSGLRSALGVRPGIAEGAREPVLDLGGVRRRGDPPPEKAEQPAAAKPPIVGPARPPQSP